MERSPLRLQQYVCRSCRISARRALGPALFSQALLPVPAINHFKTTSKYIRRYASNLTRPGLRHKHSASTSWRRSQSQDDEILQMETSMSSLLKDDHVPSDEETKEMLHAMEAAARRLKGQPDNESTEHGAKSQSPTSAILSLGSQVSRDKTVRSTTPQQSLDSINTLSQLATEYLTHPNVFITSDALQSYVRLQSILARPTSFPSVFDLFAHKPVPTQSIAKSSTIPVTFSPSSPNAIAAAIPPETADLALDTAIQVRDLPLALSVITTSYRAPAYQRHKIFKRALVPLLGAALTPVAAWTLASNLATFQTGLPPEVFTQLAFAGLGTYAVAVGTIGYVAVTSANDQMKRVTWAVGMPLWERWVREEERAAAERIAMAWGFRERSRWGEEEGAVWDGLREWVGVRGMVLDKVGLMEGME